MTQQYRNPQGGIAGQDYQIIAEHLCNTLAGDYSDMDLEPQDDWVISNIKPLGDGRLSMVVNAPGVVNRVIIAQISFR